MTTEPRTEPAAHSTTPFSDEGDAFIDGDDRVKAYAKASAEQRGGAAYVGLIAAQRLVQDRVAGAVLPPGLVDDVTERLTSLAELLAPYQAPEAERWDGWRPDIPGRAMPLLPPYVIESRSEGRLHGRVTFSRFYLGGGGAAHGGSHTLLFDDLMGYAAGQAGGVARTAYLTINYRRVTPIGVALTWDCTLDRVEGRKRFVSARLYNSEGEVVSDCEGLFLRLLAGQP